MSFVSCVLAPQRDARTVGYTLGTWLPTLAARSTGGAAVGAAGVRALNDGIVPVVTPGGGRGGGAGARGAGPGAAGATDVPLFTWAGSRGATQWVQYTFPGDETVSKAEVFWTDAAAVVAAALPGRIAVEGSRGAWPVRSRAQRVLADRIQPVTTSAMRIEVTMAPDGQRAVAEWRVGPDPALAPPADLRVDETFSLEGDVLEWTVTLANTGTRPIEIGDLAVPFNFAERTGARGDIYTKKLLRHSYVGGHGSWIYWQRSNAEGPYLRHDAGGSDEVRVLRQLDRRIHAVCPRKGRERRGDRGGRQLAACRLGLTLASTGATGSTRHLHLPLPVGARRGRRPRRPLSRGQVRYDRRARHGRADRICRRCSRCGRSTPSRRSIPSIRRATKVEAVATKNDGLTIYRASFSRLGENMLTVSYGTGSGCRSSSSSPSRSRRSSRNARRFSSATTSTPILPKWYGGVYSDWDQKNEIRSSPEDRDNLSAWLTDANDDAGNARPAFIAAKNVVLSRTRRRSTASSSTSASTSGAACR